MEEQTFGRWAPAPSDEALRAHPYRRDDGWTLYFFAGKEYDGIEEWHLCDPAGAVLRGNNEIGDDVAAAVAWADGEIATF